MTISELSVEGTASVKDETGGRLDDGALKVACDAFKKMCLEDLDYPSFTAQERLELVQTAVSAYLTAAPSRDQVYSRIGELERKNAALKSELREAEEAVAKRDDDRMNLVRQRDMAEIKRADTDPLSFEDGGPEWVMRYGDPESIRYTVASLLESYDYLLSGAINMTEATRRLRIMRAVRRQALEAKP